MKGKWKGDLTRKEKGWLAWKKGAGEVTVDLKRKQKKGEGMTGRERERERKIKGKV